MRTQRPRNCRQLQGGLIDTRFKEKGRGFVLDEMGIPKPNLPVGGVKDFVHHLPNEKNTHAPLANYMGPATNYAERIKLGIKPTTRSDAGAMRHDYAFTRIGKKLQAGILTQKQARDETRKADEQLRATCEKNTYSLNPVENVHAKAGRMGMNVKMTAEDLHLLDPLKYVLPNPRGKGGGVFGKPEQNAKPKKKRRRRDPVKKLRKLMKPV